MADDNKILNEEEIKNQDEISLDDLEDVKGGSIGNAHKKEHGDISDNTRKNI